MSLMVDGSKGSIILKLNFGNYVCALPLREDNSSTLIVILKLCFKGPLDLTSMNRREPRMPLAPLSGSTSHRKEHLVLLLSFRSSPRRRYCPSILFVVTFTRRDAGYSDFLSCILLLRPAMILIWLYEAHYFEMLQRARSKRSHQARVSSNTTTLH